MKAQSTKSGLVGLVIVLITGIVILALLGITFSDIENSSEVQAIVSFFKQVWVTYIYPSILYVWSHIVAPAFIKFFGDTATTTVPTL